MCDSLLNFDEIGTNEICLRVSSGYWDSIGGGIGKWYKRNSNQNFCDLQNRDQDTGGAKGGGDNKAGPGHRPRGEGGRKERRRSGVNVG